MKKFYESWQKIVEGTRPGDYKFIVERGPNEINISILGRDSGAPAPGKPNQHGEDTGMAQMKLQKRDDNEFWEVASIAAPKDSTGVGKELYLLALELASGSGLSPDSINISPSAVNIWNNYIKSHPQVSVEEKETEPDTSPDDPYKYIFYINPSYESDLDVIYHRLEKEPEIAEPEPPPFDPEVDLDDYLEDIYENTLPEDTNRVSKVVIYTPNGEILLLKRVDGEKNWDLPGGHLQKGENHEEGAVRETKEETGLDIEGLTHLNDHEHIKFFKCVAPSNDISLQTEEHDDFKWINPRNIDDFPVYSPIKQAILGAMQVVQEDFQQNVKKNYSKLKFKMIGQGKNTYNVGGKMKKPSYKRSKSAPPGFGGSLE